jgi:hypothetical protein
MFRGSLFLVAYYIIGGLVLLLLAGELFDQLKGKELATVYFKAGLVDQDKRDGEITKKDKYISIKSEQYGEEVFTWDQIRYISQKDKASSARRVDQLVALIELLSKLGIALTVIVFLMGLRQYNQGQKWKREEFLAAAVKEFIERPMVRNATQMLDSLALYTNGREIRLFPDDEDPGKVVHVSDDEIYNALTTKPESCLDDKAKAIRECFDTFLSYLISFYHYLDQDLITKQGLLSQIGYWFELLGPEGDLGCRYKRRVYAYAEHYRFDEVEKLVQKYHKKFNWRDLPCSDDDDEHSAPPAHPIGPAWPQVFVLRRRRRHPRWVLRRRGKG